MIHLQCHLSQFATSPGKSAWFSFVDSLRLPYPAYHTQNLEAKICLTSEKKYLKYIGADLLKMSKEDFVQICGPADGIRLFNAIKGRFVLLPSYFLIMAASLDIFSVNKKLILEL